MSYLSHHGILGQKWGVRRYQNKDGTLTPEGRKRSYHRNRMKRNIRSSDDINEIVSSLSDKEKKLLGTSLNEKYIEDKIKQNEAVVRRTIIKIGKVPVSAFEVYDNGEIAVVTRSESQYRNKGYAAKAVEAGMRAYKKYGAYTVPELYWIAEKNNVASQKLAEKMGFKIDPLPKYTDENYKYYVYKHQR